MSDPVLLAMERAGWADDPENQDRNEYSRDPRDPDKGNPHELKVKAETKRINISNAVAMNHLMSRSLSTAMMEAIGAEIRTSFVDMPRRCSGTLAKMAGNPGIERGFEKYLGDYVKTGIENVKSKVQEMCQNGFFDDIEIDI